MLDVTQTIFEMFNYLVQKHPALAPNFEAIAALAQGKHLPDVQKKQAYDSWEQIKYDAPSPSFVKQACLTRNGLDDATWVETGTYLGDTTRILCELGRPVYSIEPEPQLFESALQYFKEKSNVHIIKGLSEDVFPVLLPTLRGDICFWLDGHFSGGNTYKGPKDTPIVEELACISKNLITMNKIAIMVDDVRCFNPKNPNYSTYPSINFLVDWAREHDFSWHIEHDIFIAKSD